MILTSSYKRSALSESIRNSLVNSEIRSPNKIARYKLIGCCDSIDPLFNELQCRWCFRGFVNAMADFVLVDLADLVAFQVTEYSEHVRIIVSAIKGVQTNHSHHICTQDIRFRSHKLPFFRFLYITCASHEHIHSIHEMGDVYTICAPKREISQDKLGLDSNTIVSPLRISLSDS